MSNSLVFHIALVVAGLLIIYTVAQPQYNRVLEISESIEQFQDALDKASLANNELNARLAEYESIAQSDRNKLYDYLPDQADELRVVADLLLVAEQAGVTLDSYQSLSESEEPAQVTAQSATEESTPIDGLQIQLSVTGDYQDVKQFMSLTEVNRYPVIFKEITAGEVIRDAATPSALGGLESEPGTTFSLALLIPEYQSSETSNADDNQ